MPRSLRQSLTDIRFTRRRGMLAASLALLGGLPHARLAGAQESPPIEPIGPESTSEPETIQPGETLPPSTDGSSSSGTASGGEDVQYFAQTGHNLGVPFLALWTANGGLDTFGAPISELRYIADVNESQQTFETMTLRYVPSQPEGSRILGLPLTDKVINGIANADARRQESNSGAGQFFAETGFNVAGVILSFWTTAGGQAILGAPASREFTTGNGSTQVFQNAVIDARSDGAIGLRRIGAEWVKANKLEKDSAFIPNPPAYGETTLVSSPEGLRLRNGPSVDAEVIVVLDDNAEFMAVAGSTGEWVPGYVDGYSGWVARDYLTAPSSPGSHATAEDVKQWNVNVWEGMALGTTNIRSQPNTGSSAVREVESGAPVIVTDWVRGEEVVENSWIWAQLDDGNYVFARNVGRDAPVAPTPLPADAPTEGKWIDIQLTQQLMVAYEGRTAVRTIVITTGMPGWETPPGFYYINNRVENETMTSGAIGAEYYFKLENVLYTQYFTDRGHALHYAWWRTPETIGRPGSHGCVNMLLDDSKFMWDWASIGTPVYVRTT